MALTTFLRWLWDDVPKRDRASEKTRSIDRPPKATVTAKRNEHRRYPRLRFSAAVVIEYGDLQLRGNTVNMSLGGCWIHAGGMPPVGAQIRLRLCDRLWPALSLDAVVVRSDVTDFCVRYTVAAQEAMAPAFFAHRHGANGREWLQGATYAKAAATTAYVVGIPSRVTPAELQRVLAPSAAISSVAITRLPEGSLATVHLQYESAVNKLMDAVHGRPLLGGVVLVVAAQSAAGYTLRMALQATAQANFAFSTPSLNFAPSASVSPRLARPEGRTSKRPAAN